MCDFIPTDRSRVRLYSDFGSYDRETVYGIIDDAPICHVSTVIDGTPYIQATAHWRIDDKEITVRNPQANAVCERLHQTVAKQLRILLVSHPPDNIRNVAVLVDTCLAIALRSVRATINTTLGISPGAIAYRRDMMFDIPIAPDFQEIQEKRQAVIDKNLLRMNKRRREFRYRPGNLVLEIKDNPTKLEPRVEGPYEILHTWTNGTVTIRKREGVQQLLNVRRIRPYFTAGPQRGR